MPRHAHRTRGLWTNGQRNVSAIEEPRGANTWLVLPDDSGVFHGASTRDGVSVVHADQAYVDLDAKAERAPDAGQHLRDAVLTRLWSDRA